MRITTRVMYDLQRLRDYERGVPERAEKMITDLANKVVKHAQELVPVETGALRDSIHVESVETAGHAASALISTGPGQDSLADGEPRNYGIYVEWGHGPNPFRPDGSPRPFMVPAAFDVMEAAGRDTSMIRYWTPGGWGGV